MKRGKKSPRWPSEEEPSAMSGSNEPEVMSEKEDPEAPLDTQKFVQETLFSHLKKRLSEELSPPTTPLREPMHMLEEEESYDGEQEEKAGKQGTGWIGLRVRKWTTSITRSLKVDALYSGENAAYIILATREVIIYSIYFTTLLLMLFETLDNRDNFYSSITSDLLTKSKFLCSIGNLRTVETFQTIASPHHIWCFVNQVLMVFLYSEQMEGRRVVLMDNIVIGAPGMIQVRVKNGSCDTAPMFADLYKTCYDYYHQDIEDERTFGEGTSAFRWRPGPVEVAAGLLSFGAYTRGGYQFNFTSNATFTKAWLGELKNHLWIREGTRFVVIDFALYTPNSNIFCIVRLNFELLPTGGVLSSSNFHIAKLLRYVGPWDLFVLSCEVLNFMLVLYFTYEEAFAMRNLGLHYFANRWNILNLAIIITSYSLFLTSIYGSIILRTLIPEKVSTINTNNYPSFNVITSIHELSLTIRAILMFFAFMRLFKFAVLNKSISLTVNTMSRAFPMFLVLVLQTVIISIGFALLGKLLFGEYIVQFSTFSSSLFSMYGMYVGRINFCRRCIKAHPIAGPLFFGTYIVSVCMIYLNAFVGVVVFAYRDERNLINEHPKRQYMLDLLFNAGLELLWKLRLARMHRYFTVRNIVSQRQLDYDEFVNILKRHNIYGLELRLVLNQYELKRGNEMKFDTFFEIYNDILERHQLRIETEGHERAQELIKKTEQTVENCMNIILDVQSKIEILMDSLLSKVAQSEKGTEPEEKKEEKKQKSKKRKKGPIGF